MKLRAGRSRSNMNRITDRFARLKAEGRKGFIPYITAGDPDLATTEALMVALADAGADVIELGVPFSDPMADGPVIQRASERALKNPVGVAEILPIVEKFRQQSELPIVLFTYFNPLLQCCGVDHLTALGAKLKAAGVDGVLITDLIPEEAHEFSDAMHAAGIETIFLVAPTSTDERVQLIGKQATGFVYVVARTGVTGMRETAAQDISTIVARVRRYIDLPVAVGFGIYKPEHVREVWRFADAAVVGTRLVLEVENNLGSPDLVTKVAALARELINH